RERIAFLLDQDSFIELHPFRESQVLTREQRMLGDGVVTGYCTIAGRSIYVFAQDFTVCGGALGDIHAKKICALMDLAA
ncbi:acyl-CoA carboxylase subunit beta, partial [Bacillus vallismortis]|nr:acyl-CoA carboxylase subunit beta [Bacillus vallismortis]